jgi:hypothetical protein
MMKGMAAARLRRAVKSLKRGSVLKAGQRGFLLSAEERFRADSSGVIKINDLRYSR